MVALLKKDLLVLWPTMLGVLLYIVLSYALNLSPVFAYYVMVLGGLFNTFYYDNQAGVNKYVASMPISRKMLVAEKYLLCFIIAVFVFIFQFGINLLIPFLDFLEYDYETMDKYSILTFLCGVLIVMSLSIPLYIRFSHLIAFVIQIFCFTFLPGVIYLIMHFLIGLNVEMLFEAMSQIADLIAQYPFSIILPATILIMTISFGISTWLFQRKDLV